MVNPNEPTFMIDLVSIIDNFAKSPRLVSRILEDCKKSLPAYAFCEYGDTIYFNSKKLGGLAYLLFKNGHISRDNEKDINKFWDAHWKELMTEYPRRDAMVEGPNSSEEDNPDLECYMYAQYGECSDPQCKYKHPGANLLTPREYKEAVREDKARMLREGIALPRLSRRNSSSARSKARKRGRPENKDEYDPREDEKEDEYDPREDEEEDEREEEEDEAMMDMIIDDDDEDEDGDVGEDDVEEDYIQEPQRRAMDFSERETIINLNTQTISSLTAAGQYFMARQRRDGEILPHYDRVLEEIDAGVTNAVNELQRFIPVGSQAAIQVQADLGDEYLDSAVRVTKRVVELGHSLRDLDNEDFRRMMKEVGIRASDLHKQVFGKKPKKVAMNMGRGGRKYFNYYSERTAPRTLDVAIGEWFRNYARDQADRAEADRQAAAQRAKRPRIMDDFVDDNLEQRQIEDAMDEIAQDEEEFYALVEEAENQPETCPNCDDGHLEKGSCTNNCGYHEALEVMAEEAQAAVGTPAQRRGLRPVTEVIADFFGYGTDQPQSQGQSEPK